MKHIPSNRKQEEALTDLYQSVGYNDGLADCLTFLEKELGSVNKITIEVRKMLYFGKGKDLRDKSRKSGDDANLTDLLMKRYDLHDRNGD